MWIKHSQPAVVLAPMEGITDAPMRQVLSECGGLSFCVSEFLRVCHDIFPPKVFRKHVPEFDQECLTSVGAPVQLQILGSDHDAMAQNAQKAVTLGAKAIDINFGCPAPQVNRNDGGASLLRTPERLRTIVAAVRAAVPREIPVSAKLRLGWDSPDAIYRNTEEVVLGGASWITIHARTKTQGYTPPAYWKYIGEVRKQIPIPVVANGDIWNLDDFRRCRDETACEHFMLGRGAVASPALPFLIASELGLKPKNYLNLDLPKPNSPDLQHWLPLLGRFIEISQPYSQGNWYTTARIKQWLKMAYLRGNFPWFDQVKTAKTVGEILTQINGQTGCPNESLPIEEESYAESCH